MAVRVLVVQHGDKLKAPGDPGLTDVGRRQAEAAAVAIAAQDPPPAAVWSSDLRRAAETAAPIARWLRVEPRQDDRFRERMNWDDADRLTIDEFLAEWGRATADRAYQPTMGDSSAAAADRFLAALADVTALADPTDTIVVVAHGGVTTDVLRTVLGDDALRSRAPTLIDHGVPPCAITTLVQEGDTWTAESIAVTAHLDRPEGRG